MILGAVIATIRIKKPHHVSYDGVYRGLRGVYIRYDTTVSPMHSSLSCGIFVYINFERD